MLKSIIKHTIGVTVALSALLVLAPSAKAETMTPPPALCDAVMQEALEWLSVVELYEIEIQKLDNIILSFTSNEDEIAFAESLKADYIENMNVSQAQYTTFDTLYTLICKEI